MDEREILLDILGFDPETGKRLEDSNRPVGPVKERMPPPKIQEAFTEYVEKKYHPDFEIRINPGELFVALKGPFIIGRTYHSYNPSLAPKDQIFPCVAHAEFIDYSVTDEDHEYKPFAIHYLDEAEKEEDANRMILRFNNVIGAFLSGVHSWFVLKKRTLYVEDLEHVSEVRFTEEKGEQDIFDIALFKEIGATNFKNGTVVDDENQVLIQHQGQGLIDKVLIPRGRKDEEIIAQLFEEDDLLNDPFSAPTSLDHSWRFADIRGLTGIRWEIETIPLENISTPTDKFVPVSDQPTHHKITFWNYVGKKIFNFMFKSHP